MRQPKTIRKIIWDRFFLSDRSYFFTVLCGLIIAFLSSFSRLHALAILVFLLFPFILVIRTTFKNAVVALPFIIGLNFLNAITALVIVNLLKLPVDSLVLVIFVIFEILLTIFVNAKLRRSLFDDLFKRVDYRVVSFIYVFFVLALVSRVYSIHNALVPILHDPEAHAFWAKRIVQERAINYFYSPGLHMWAALLNEATGISLAKAVSLLTNTLSALSVLYWGLATSIVTKNKLVPVFVAFFMLVIPLPTNLYFLAGKNAFITAVPFLGLLIVVLCHFLKSKSVQNSLLLWLVLVGIGILHYPAYAYALGLVCIALLFGIVKDKGPRRQSIFIRSAIISYLPIFISIVFIGLLLFTTHRANNNIPQVLNRAAATQFHAQSEQAGKIAPTQRLLEAPSGKVSHLHNPVKAVTDLSKEIVDFINSLTHSQGLLLAGAGIVSIYFILNQIFSRHFAWDSLEIIAFSLIAALATIMLTLSIVTINSLGTTIETGYLLLFVAAVLPLSLLFARITNWHFLLIGCILIVIGSYSSYKTFDVFKNYSKQSFVDNSDLQAYLWINARVPAGSGFVGFSQLGPTRNNIVYSVDGSLWLPVFTNDKISTPFEDSGFSSVQSHINYEYLRMLSSPNTNEEKTAADYFINNGYRYIYIDGNPEYGAMGIDRLLERGYAKIIYVGGSIKIAQLL